MKRIICILISVIICLETTVVMGGVILNKPALSNNSMSIDTYRSSLYRCYPYVITIPYGLYPGYNGGGGGSNGCVVGLVMPEEQLEKRIVRLEHTLQDIDKTLRGLQREIKELRKELRKDKNEK
jgi:hypothetical protein